jgi:hypothetical protein
MKNTFRYILVLLALGSIFLVRSLDHGGRFWAYPFIVVTIFALFIFWGALKHAKKLWNKKEKHL